MIINFGNIILRGEPNNANQGMGVTLTSNSTTQVEETQFKSVDVETNTLTTAQKKIVNDFITLMKSKLPA